MVNVSNTALGFQKRPGARSKQGFSLVELMCVLAIASVMASLAWPSVVGLMSGNGLTNNAYQLSGLMQQARATALAQHTYVWVGVRSYTNQDGTPAMMVAALADNCGLVSDLPDAQPTNFSLASKPAIIKNVTLASTSAYTALPGLDSTDNTDAPTQSGYTFHLSVPGYPNAAFSNVIVFGPDGQACLPQSSGALLLTQCIGLGINLAPNPGSHLHTAAIQVRGLTGQVSVYQQ